MERTLAANLHGEQRDFPPARLASGAGLERQIALTALRLALKILTDHWTDLRKYFFQLAQGKGTSRIIP